MQLEVMRLDEPLGTKVEEIGIGTRGEGSRKQLGD
jgi:hypothetical protein